MRPRNTSFNHTRFCYELVLDDHSRVERFGDADADGVDDPIPHLRPTFARISRLLEMKTNSSVDVLGVVKAVFPAKDILTRVCILSAILVLEEAMDFVRSFIRSFIHPLIYLSAHSSIHSFIHPLIHSSAHSLISSFIHPLIHSSALSFIRSFIHPLFHSTALSFNRSFIHPLIHSSAHSFIRSYSAQNGKSTTKRDVELVDLSMRSVTMTLWGETANTFHVELNQVLSATRLRLSDFGG